MGYGAEEDDDLAFDVIQYCLKEKHKIAGYSSFRPVFDTEPRCRTEAQCEALRPLLETVQSFHAILPNKEMTHRLCRVLTLVTVAIGGKTLIAEGEVGDCCYVVIAGRFQISVFDGEKQHFVGVCKAGDTIGEVALRESCRRNATVTSMEASELLRVDIRDYNSLIKAFDEQDSQRKMNFLRRAPALRAVRDHDVKEMVKRTFFKVYAAGETLWREEDGLDSMRYLPIVIRGEVALLKQVKPKEDDEQRMEEKDVTQSSEIRESSLQQLGKEIKEAARRRTFQRMHYREAGTNDNVWKSRQLGICTVGPGGCILETPMLEAACEASKSDRIVHHETTVVATVRTEIGWLSRYFFHLLLHKNAAFRDQIVAWTIQVPSAHAVNDMVATNNLWYRYRAALLRDLSPRHREFVAAERTYGSKRISEMLRLKAVEADEKERIRRQKQQRALAKAATLAMLRRSQQVLKRRRKKSSPLVVNEKRRMTVILEEKKPPPPLPRPHHRKRQEILGEKVAAGFTMLPFRHPTDQKSQFRHRLRILDDEPSYPKVVEDLPTKAEYDTFPDKASHPLSPRNNPDIPYAHGMPSFAEPHRPDGDKKASQHRSPTKSSVVAASTVQGHRKSLFKSSWRA